MFRYNIFESVKISLFFLLLPLCFFSCRTTVDEVQEDTGDTFISRPKIIIESPRGTLPLRLKWQEVSGSRGYEIQMSDTANFTSSLRNLTIRKNSFYLDELGSPILYIRVRSLLEGDTSRWSDTLQVSRKDGEISLQWVR